VASPGFYVQPGFVTIAAKLCLAGLPEANAPVGLFRSLIFRSVLQCIDPAEIIGRAQWFLGFSEASSTCTLVSMRT
jgi:hypothetical protein